MFSCERDREGERKSCFFHFISGPLPTNIHTHKLTHNHTYVVSEGNIRNSLPVESLVFYSNSCICSEKEWEWREGKISNEERFFNSRRDWLLPLIYFIGNREYDRLSFFSISLSVCCWSLVVVGQEATRASVFSCRVYCLFHAPKLLARYCCLQHFSLFFAHLVSFSYLRLTYVSLAEHHLNLSSLPVSSSSLTLRHSKRSHTVGHLNTWLQGFEAIHLPIKRLKASPSSVRLILVFFLPYRHTCGYTSRPRVRFRRISSRLDTD